MNVSKRKRQSQSSSHTANLEQIQVLIGQGKPDQAAQQLNKLNRQHPNQDTSDLEGQISIAKGRQDLEIRRFRQAETQFQRALQAGSKEAYYWLVKTYLAQEQLQKALQVIEPAFDSGDLPLEQAGCYLKLLVLLGNTEQVQELLQTQGNRFTGDQKHWVQGVLELLSANPTAAMAQFQQIESTITPGDNGQIWAVYALQQGEQWPDAEAEIARQVELISEQGLFSSQPQLSRPLQRLMVIQSLNTDSFIEAEFLQLEREPLLYQQAVQVLRMLQQIRDQQFHEAGHSFLKVVKQKSTFSQDLAALQRPLLLKAGEAALHQNALNCAETFWLPLIKQDPFDPKLARHLIKVLDDNQSYREGQRLLTRWINWLEQEAKHDPQTWSPERLNPILATLQCWLTDIWMALGQVHTGYGALRRAERLDPEGPEVLGRLGLKAYLEDRQDNAKRLMIQALEKGCRFREVYGNLIDCLEEMDDHQTCQEIRRRFGKDFGDMGQMLSEVELPLWIEALALPAFPLFRVYVKNNEDANDPALQAYRIFIASVDDIKSERTDLNQEQAKQQWDRLLTGLPPEKGCIVRQAILACIHRYAKRRKGLAALAKHYLQQMQALIPDYPEAESAYLALLALRGPESELQKRLPSYLNRMAQPDQALARLQMQVRKLGYSHLLRSYIDAALVREPQNSLLLLAKATTFSPRSQPYEEIIEQGFELARRLQHQETLQAWREEEQLQMMRNSLQSPHTLPFPDIDQDILRELIERLMEARGLDLDEDGEKEEDMDDRTQRFRSRDRSQSNTSQRSKGFGR
ncbi:MAG: hypothetical protein HC921_10250 [Synechococcaceae cyanobacterium SM2_3_1]|nr:hypothetical protein [Synechococcaceae cyanobacterium SM2_3_1]